MSNRSALELAVLEWLQSFSHKIRNHDRLVILSAICSIIPTPHTSLLSIILIILNKMLISSGRLAKTEQIILNKSMICVTSSILIQVLLFYFLSHTNIFSSVTEIFHDAIFAPWRFVLKLVEFVLQLLSVDEIIIKP